MNFTAWCQALGVAALGGAASGATQMMSSTGKVTTATAVAAGIGALLNGLAYILKSPFTAASPAPKADPVVEPPRAA